MNQLLVNNKNKIVLILVLKKKLGLDASTACNVMNCLRDLSANGCKKCTIVRYDYFLFI